MKLHVAMSCLIPPVLAVAVLTGDSPAARQAFEGSVTAIAKGDELFGESGRCYMDGL